MAVGNCRICTRLAESARLPDGAIWRNERWILRHAAAPYGVIGWLTLYSQRHVPGIADLDAREAASLGVVLQKASQELRQATNAERIYIAALAESCPHFHCHLVPRYADIPPEEVGWNLFQAGLRASRGEVVISPGAVRAISNEMADRLREF